jgi:hypothetical protein
VVGSSTATSLIVDKNGNVGVGTATPSVNLEINTTRPVNAVSNVDQALKVNWTTNATATDFPMGIASFITNSGSTVASNGHMIGVFGEALDTTTGAVSLY